MSGECLRLLIVEPEPLIAIDIERIVGDIYQCEAMIVTDLAKAPSDAWDLVICDCPELTTCFVTRLTGFLPEGAGVVLVSASDGVVNAQSPWPHVGKPFANSLLLKAVERALATRPMPDEPA
ncbi:MAG: hypothetical protein R3D65_07720 [Zhengella sp.]|uniref:hypothetical protein n=1 Tax=Zhengella sp. TaxID=2282762 RepID=UPI001D65FB77|nr:hypothetical protein [Notoacmeibacter sp.]MCC0025759.1 hypothetical protein [Brucellaceae bacterium]